ncbi:MAG TPA: glycogen debranching N-terminal domain-containing protein [Gaiellaceae bacterium]|nr:glycogen debranching N-terminal domain-containing protein [Gaiellaceae bacterium]
MSAAPEIDLPVTVLDGSTFVVCDDRGDVDGLSAASGLFAEDTRFLSRLVVTVDGERSELVEFEQAAPHVAAFELRGPAGIRVRRELFVGSGLEQTITVENRSERGIDAVIGVESASDFADIHAVKRVADGGAAAHASSRPEQWDDAATVEFADDGFPARTLVHLVPAPDEHEAGVARYRLWLEPGESRRVVVAVQCVLDGAVPLDGAAFEDRLREDRRERDDSLARWWRSMPRLAAPGEPALEPTWTRSLADLAALRLRWAGSGMVPAAGLPWFMTLFGRDTLITAFQTIPLGPDLAAAVLRALAETQSDADDPRRDAEPGKIVHEIRRGKTALVWSDRYYGTVDATPLFLVLLSELWRWSGDDAIVRELEPNARRALAWIDGPGDRDGDGLVEYLRRAPNGLDNQSWKDSHNSMVFRDGSLAHAPITPVEAQGYVYDAKLRTAELARRVWSDDETAARLEREAAELRRRFDAAFWLPEHGWYALGLDGAKRPIDALASNMGHLLWSGLVPPERVAAVAGRLTAGPLWSGWGIRTLAADEAAFDPVEYHDGTVWPHDNSLIAYGLARSGHAVEAQRVVRALLDCASFFEHRLPEHFAGFERSGEEPPGAVPASARPQAWAAGTPVLLLRALLRLEPDPDARVLHVADGALPEWAEGLTVDGVHAFGRRWDVRVEGGAASVAQREPMTTTPSSST